jgi:hypothetical protein
MGTIAGREKCAAIYCMVCSIFVWKLNKKSFLSINCLLFVPSNYWIDVHCHNRKQVIQFCCNPHSLIGFLLFVYAGTNTIYTLSLHLQLGSFSASLITSLTEMFEWIRGSCLEIVEAVLLKLYRASKKSLWGLGYFVNHFR